MRFEVLSQPTRKPFRIQFSIWQDISKTGGHSETISGNVNLSGGTGSVTATSIGSPASWWQIRTDSPVDFTRPEDFYRIGIVLWKGNCVVKGQGWGTDGCPEYQAEFFPLQARITVVAVAQGSTFSGWSNCNGGSTTPLLTISPASKTVSSASGLLITTPMHPPQIVLPPSPCQGQASAIRLSPSIRKDARYPMRQQ
jgi:hypothetical protein